MIDPHGSMRMAVLLMAAVVLLSACKKEQPKDPSLVPVQNKTTGIVNAKQVVLIVVDALKASALSAYGYSRETSPNLEELAKQGVLFEQFRSASCWTVPSFATLTNGLAPSAAHAGDFFKRGRYERGAPPLRKDIPTLAEQLGDEIASGALVTNPYLHPYRGLGRGYDVYDHENADHEHYRDAEEAMDTAIEWIVEHRNQPFFYMLHLFDPHVPYMPPAQIARQFVRHDPGRIEMKSRKQFREIRTHKLKPTEEEKGYLRDMYDAEVRYVDNQLGRLMKTMEERDLLSSSYIVFTADHGEEHFEHGGLEHGHRFEDEVVRIPLVIRAPGGKWHAGERVPWSASHIDIVPTILDWFGKKIPSHLKGKSLNALISGKEKAHRKAYMEHNLYGPYRFAWFDGRYKVITDRVGNSSWLYDLKEDPLEKKKIYKHPKLDELKGKLFKHREALAKSVNVSSDKGEAPPIPPDVEKALKSLGYID